MAHEQPAKPKPWERGYVAPAPAPQAAPSLSSGEDAGTTKEALNVETATSAEISQAVKFLLHAKVRSAPIATKRKFLESKGLSSAMIDEAIRKATAAGSGSDGDDGGGNGGGGGSGGSAAATTPAGAAAPGSGSEDTTPNEESRTRSSSWSLAIGGAIGAIAGGVLAWASTRSSDTPPKEGADGSEGEEGTPRDSTPTASASSSLPLLPTDAHRWAASGAEASLAAMRAMRAAGAAASAAALAVDAVRAAVGELVRGAPSVAAAHEALHAVVVLLNAQLKHPTEARYQRLNPRNASMQRLLALPGSSAVLQALGFAQEAGASFYAWRTDGALPGPDDLALIAAQRDVFHEALTSDARQTSEIP
jgi:hypothetical protein